MKNLGWVIAGILIGVIIYILFLKPAPIPDNHVLQNKVDSFTVVDKAKDSDLIALQARLNPKIDSLSKLTDTLQDDIAGLRDDLDGKNSEAVFYARQYQYYKAKSDTGESRAACDLLAQRVILDSAIIESYIHTNERLIYTFGDLVKDKDSIITAQRGLILSDSALIVTQKDLNQKQGNDIKKLAKQKNVLTWAGRGLAVGLGALIIALSLK